MGYMKTIFQEKIENNLKIISNNYDGEAEVFLCQKMDMAYDKLLSAIEEFNEIDATFDAYVKENPEGRDDDQLWDACRQYSAKKCENDFDDAYEVLKNIDI